MKDAREVLPSDNITVQVDGALRRLIIRSAEMADAGTYACRCGDRSVEFEVNVRGMAAGEGGRMKMTPGGCHVN